MIVNRTVENLEFLIETVKKCDAKEFADRKDSIIKMLSKIYTDISDKYLSDQRKTNGVFHKGHIPDDKDEYY